MYPYQASLGPGVVGGYPSGGVRGYFGIGSDRGMGERARERPVYQGERPVYMGIGSERSLSLSASMGGGMSPYLPEGVSRSGMLPSPGGVVRDPYREGQRRGVSASLDRAGVDRPSVFHSASEGRDGQGSDAVSVPYPVDRDTERYVVDMSRGFPPSGTMYMERGVDMPRDYPPSDMYAEGERYAGRGTDPLSASVGRDGLVSRVLSYRSPSVDRGSVAPISDREMAIQQFLQRAQSFQRPGLRRNEGLSLLSLLLQKPEIRGVEGEREGESNELDHETASMAASQLASVLAFQGCFQRLLDIVKGEGHQGVVAVQCLGCVRLLVEGNIQCHSLMRDHFPSLCAVLTAGEWAMVNHSNSTRADTSTSAHRRYGTVTTATLDVLDTLLSPSASSHATSAREREGEREREVERRESQTQVLQSGVFDRLLSICTRFETPPHMRCPALHTLSLALSMCTPSQLALLRHPDIPLMRLVTMSLGRDQVLSSQCLSVLNALVNTCPVAARVLAASLHDPSAVPILREQERQERERAARAAAEGERQRERERGKEKGKGKGMFRSGFKILAQSFMLGAVTTDETGTAVSESARLSAEREREALSPTRRIYELIQPDAPIQEIGVLLLSPMLYVSQGSPGSREIARLLCRLALDGGDTACKILDKAVIRMPNGASTLIAALVDTAVTSMAQSSLQSSQSGQSSDNWPLAFLAACSTCLAISPALLSKLEEGVGSIAGDTGAERAFVQAIAAISRSRLASVQPMSAGLLGATSPEASTASLSSAFETLASLDLGSETCLSSVREALLTALAEARETEKERERQRESIVLEQPSPVMTAPHDTQESESGVLISVTSTAPSAVPSPPLPVSMPVPSGVTSAPLMPTTVPTTSAPLAPVVVPTAPPPPTVAVPLPPKPTVVPPPVAPKPHTATTAPTASGVPTVGMVAPPPSYAMFQPVVLDALKPVRGIQPPRVPYARTSAGQTPVSHAPMPHVFTPMQAGSTATPSKDSTVVAPPPPPPAATPSVPTVTPAPTVATTTPMVPMVPTSAVATPAPPVAVFQPMQPVQPTSTTVPTVPTVPTVSMSAPLTVFQPMQPGATSVSQTVPRPAPQTVSHTTPMSVYQPTPLSSAGTTGDVPPPPPPSATVAPPARSTTVPEEVPQSGVIIMTPSPPAAPTVAVVTPSPITPIKEEEAVVEVTSGASAESVTVEEDVTTIESEEHAETVDACEAAVSEEQVVAEVEAEGEMETASDSTAEAVSVAPFSALAGPAAMTTIETTEVEVEREGEGGKEEVEVAAAPTVESAFPALAGLAAMTGGVSTANEGETETDAGMAESTTTSDEPLDPQDVEEDELPNSDDFFDEIDTLAEGMEAGVEAQREREGMEVEGEGEKGEEPSEEVDTNPDPFAEEEVETVTETPAESSPEVVETAAEAETTPEATSEDVSPTVETPVVETEPTPALSDKEGERSPIEAESVVEEDPVATPKKVETSSVEAESTPAESKMVEGEQPSVDEESFSREGVSPLDMADASDGEGFFDDVPEEDMEDMDGEPEEKGAVETVVSDGVPEEGVEEGAYIAVADEAASSVDSAEGTTSPSDVESDLDNLSDPDTLSDRDTLRAELAAALTRETERQKLISELQERDIENRRKTEELRAELERERAERQRIEESQALYQEESLQLDCYIDALKGLMESAGIEAPGMDEMEF
ncbi:hypothetical protein KIPB_002692 [Kipferlia bialata]|uniref:Armadillo-type fold n=1 Tax=Kipferlia bialata TaxID=797122 RepID=A0A9K3CRT7_9EUKA|nr:hypothetical protein KIPB_002692 [Kipferlia bialata]|eukprot:g2692.t1